MLKAAGAGSSLSALRLFYQLLQQKLVSLVGIFQQD